VPGLTDLELYRLFDRSPVGMFRSNQDGVFIYANGALATLLGYTIAELLELDLDDVYVDLELRQELLRRFFPQRVVDRIEFDWRRKDGGIVTVEVWGHVVDHEGGWSFDASVVDVTEVKRQREELERTKRTLELVVNQMPAMYWVVDTKLNITRTGGAFRTIMGYPPGTFIEISLAEHHRTDPGSTDPVPFHERALAGETCSYDTTYHNRQFAVTVAPYRQADGTLLGAIGTLNDVTQSRTLERRLVDAQRAESLGVLAGGLAHDFNNLLVAILGNADLALRELPRGMPGRAAIENARDAGVRAAELTHQLLTFSGQAGAGTTRMSPAIVVEELLRLLGPSLPPAIKITSEIPSELQLRADPGQLRQVLLNLITNARDAVIGNGGSIELRGSILDERRRRARRTWRVCPARSDRRRRRHGRRDPQSRVRAVLHDEGTRPRHRTRRGARHRAGPSRWLAAGHEAGARRDVPGPVACRGLDSGSCTDASVDARDPRRAGHRR